MATPFLFTNTGFDVSARDQWVEDGQAWRGPDGRSLSHPLLVWIDVYDVSRVSTHAQPN
jgi:hypothetical protein